MRIYDALNLVGIAFVFIAVQAFDPRPGRTSFNEQAWRNDAAGAGERPAPLSTPICGRASSIIDHNHVGRRRIGVQVGNQFFVVGQNRTLVEIAFIGGLIFIDAGLFIEDDQPLDTP